MSTTNVTNTNHMNMTISLPDLSNHLRIQKAELIVTQIDSNLESNLPRIGIFEENSENLIDYERVKAMAADPVQYTFDIQKLLDKAYGENKNSMNLCVKMLDETTESDGYITICGTSHASYAPALSIGYQESNSGNSDYQAHTHELGCMGQGSVDLECGNLMFEVENFGWEGNRMPLSMKHLYNSSNPAFDMKLGLGWRLNMMQNVAPVVFQHEGVEYNGYVFTTENGEKIYFKESTVSAGDSINGEYYLYEAVTDSDVKFNPVIRFVQMDECYYLFDENGALFMISDEFGNNTVFTYEAGKLISVTDPVGRSFQLAYNADGYLTSITAPDGTAVTYAYTGNLLTGINFPGGKKAILQYASNQPAAVILQNAASENLYKVTYEYSSGRVSKVTEYGVEEDTFVKGVSTDFDYSAASKRTMITTTEPKDAAEGETEDTITQTVYTFDAEGNVISEYVYTEETGNTGTKNNITPQSNDGGIVYNNNNLLLEHDFRTLSNWSGMEENSEQFGVFAGEHELVFPYHKDGLMMAIEADCVANGVYQQTGVLAAGKYTFSAYVRAFMDITGETDPGIYIRITDVSGNVLAESEHISESTDYIRLVEPFELDEAQAVKVQILMNGAGIVLANAPQLENNPVANSYNLLENGHFEHGTTGWTINGAAVTTTESFNMDKSLGISGDLEVAKYARQDVYVNPLNSTRETFILSGWAKGYGIVKRERDNCQEPLFRLRAVLYYSDTVEGEANEEEFIADFSPYTEDWQFASVQIEKSKYRTVDYVSVYCEYSYNWGEVYFEDIQLVRNSRERNLTADDFETEATDEEGTEDSAEETTEDFEEAKDNYGNVLTETLFNEAGTEAIYRSFAYSSNGNDLIRETDPRGNETTYTVDAATSRNTQITDRCGNKTSYEYDSVGRTTKVISKDSEGTEVSNVTYSYDSFDNMTEIVRGDGMKYVLAYNAFHNLESVGIQGKTEKLVSYTYKDGNGRLKEVAYANGDVLKITYNRLGQVSSEKWYNAAGTLISHYKYSYDNQDNVVRSIDLLGKKEYDYLYDEDRIVRATECDITLNESEMVVSKSLVSMIVYKYDSEGRLTYKQIISAAGTEQELAYMISDEDKTTLSYKAGTYDVNCSSDVDELGRKTSEWMRIGILDLYREFTYHAGQVTAEHTANNKVKGTATTDLVSQITLRSASGGVYKTLSYEYDKEERITKVIDSVAGTTEYTYDALGQLLTEKVNGVVVNSMTYDNYGNILTKNGIPYTYGDSVWKDKLTAYNGQSISYDAQGNPTSYLGHTLTWEKGRQLKSFDNISYTYNANGIRTAKTVGGVKHTYVLEGTNILKETWGSNELVPMYDNEENVCGIIYNGTPYCFRKNLQGDIISITNIYGNEIARYSYDAWGVCSIVVDTSDDHIASVNPYRYRGYYFDVETGFYYVSSRYYDPEIGRFFNSDDPAIIDCASDCSIVSLNKYTYCLNNSINNEDTYGTISTAVVKMILNFIWGMSGGLLGMYASDVSTNMIKGRKNILKRIQSVGTYVAEGVRAGCIAIFGNKIVKRIIVAVGTAVIKNVTDVIFGGKSYSLRKLLKDIVTGVVAAVVICSAPKVAKQLNKNRGQAKKKLISRVVNFLKNKFKKIINFFKNTFVKRFSISYAKTMFSNIKSLVFG